VCAGTGHLGTHAEPGAGLSSQPRQPVRSTCPWDASTTSRRLHLLVAHRPTTWPAVFAVDTSTWAHCDAETSPERGFYHSASKHSAGQPIVADRPYQWITQLDWAFDSWTTPVDAARIPPTADDTTFTIEQVTHLAQHLPDDGPVPMFVFDTGYDPIAIGAALTDTAAQVLARIRGDRIFYTDPNHRGAAAIGRPRRHGTRSTPSDPENAPAPTAELSVQDKHHGKVHVNNWTSLHPNSDAAAAGPTTTTHRSWPAPWST